jgi:hypothetical protein
LLHHLFKRLERLSKFKQKILKIMQNLLEEWIELFKIFAPLLAVILICLFQAYSFQSSITEFLEKFDFKFVEKIKNKLSGLYSVCFLV